MSEIDGLDRRQFVQRALAAGALVLPAGLTACGSDGGTPKGGREIQSKQAIFGYFGGDFGAAQKKVFFDGFTDKTGVRVTTPAADPARFQLMGRRGRAQWDATDADGYQAYGWAREGILAKLPSWVRRCDLIDAEVRDHLSAGYAFSLCQGYQRAAFSSEGPKTWRDFWDVERFPGRRAYPKFFPGALEAALMADGADKDRLYPLDIDRALAKLDEIRDHLLFYDTYGQGAQFLAQGSVSIAFVPASRTYFVGQQGKPTEIVWDQAVLIPYSASCVLKDAPHADAAFALVDWMTDPRRQAKLAQLTLNAPANTAAFEHIPKRFHRNLVNSPERKAQAAVVDTPKLAAQYTEVERRYTEWLS